MALILLRHTLVDLPVGTCYGQLDAPLRWPAEPSFETVAARLREALKPGLHLSHIVSSPLQRARLLAAELAARWGLAVSTDARWQELDFGAWEGQPWATIDRSHSDHWAEDVWDRAPPGGETLQALTARVLAAAADLRPAASQPGQAVLVVAHAGSIRVLLGAALGQPPQAPLPMALDLGGCHVLQPDEQQPGGWRIGA